MGYYAIGACVLVTGALGIAYVTLDPFSSDQDRQEVASEPLSDADVTADPATSRPNKNSAARLMDDFGSGPSGATITVPLKGRHQQAYLGSTAAPGGGGDASDSVPKIRVIQRDVAPANSDAKTDAEADVETAAVAPAATDDNEKEIEAPIDAVIAPSFDVVRVDPTGSTVLAGRAVPGVEVEVKVGDRVIDRVVASERGEWVSTPAEPLPSGDQELSLTAVPEVGEPVESKHLVVVSVPETTVESTELVESRQPDDVVAVVVNKEEGGEGRILQAPDKLQSAGDERLALKVVDYDDKGAIRLTGEAPPGVPVRIYIDNVPSALVIGDSKGNWITTLSQDLPAGDYTLRLDQLDIKGQTVARLETPMTRVATPPAQGQTKVDYVVVQPGNSLWRIARRLSGDGFNYVYIFEANQAQIRDPDVIYPGQVFEVPVDVETEIAG